MGIRRVILAGILLAAIGSAADGGSVTLGTCAGRAGGTAEMAVSVDSATELAGVNIRVAFADAVLGAPIVRGNPEMLAPEHEVVSHVPESGRLDIVAWTAGSGGAFRARSGEVFRVRFEIDAAATEGTYAVTFATEGPAILASSGLSDTRGRSLAHEAAAGQVVVVGPHSCDLNGDGRTDDLDLFVIAENWHQASTGVADINGDGWIDLQDLLRFTGDWKEPITVGSSVDPGE